MKVLVIDNDPAIIESINLTFELGWPEAKVVAADTGNKGIEIIEQESPSAIILALNLPGTNGFDVLKEIRLFSEIPVLILTIRGAEQDIVKAFTWGANDYMTKPFRQMEFLARVKAMTRSVQMPDREMKVCFGSWHFGRSLTELFHGHDRYELTPVEGLIMHTLIKHSEQYVDSSVLMAKVWGETHTATADSLRVHLCHLRKKLGDDHVNPHTIVNKPGRGYILLDHQTKEQGLYQTHRQLSPAV